MGGRGPFTGTVVTLLLDRRLDGPVTLSDNVSDDALSALTADLDALLRRVAHRDPEAFAALYDATRSRVYGMVARVLRDR